MSRLTRNDLVARVGELVDALKRATAERDQMAAKLTATERTLEGVIHERDTMRSLNKGVALRLGGGRALVTDGESTPEQVMAAVRAVHAVGWLPVAVVDYALTMPGEPHHPPVIRIEAREILK